jgi:hypothetical protein
MKKCGKCKVEKPLDDYYKMSRAKDGRQNYCKDCSQAARRKHYQDYQPLMRLDWKNYMSDPEVYKRVRKQQTEANRRWLAKKNKL